MSKKTVCDICYDSNKLVLLDCQHSICIDCLFNMVASSNNKSCPFCRAEFKYMSKLAESVNTRYKNRINKLTNPYIKKMTTYSTNIKYCRLFISLLIHLKYSSFHLINTALKCVNNLVKYKDCVNAQILNNCIYSMSINNYKQIKSVIPHKKKKYILDVVNSCAFYIAVEK